MNFKRHTNKYGETILYIGAINLQILDKITEGPGDIWHSSFEQGYKNAFHDIVYQASVFFWYINDFDGLDQCVSWRINPHQFAIRKTVWDQLGGFDTDYNNIQLQALEFGYNALRNQGAIPMYIKGLFSITKKEVVSISPRDRYIFYRKNFTVDNSFLMLYRKGLFSFREWIAFLNARVKYSTKKLKPAISPRELKTIIGTPSVSYIIPTMLRQNYTLQLIDDLTKQTYPVSQIVVIDATPEAKRDISNYTSGTYPFEVIFKWQTSKGSCRARNEAIAYCTGDYIVFGDDDVRVPPDFIENHIRLLQTYGAVACNGLDIRADHQKQSLADLYLKLENLKGLRWKVGATQNFSNANSCVRSDYVKLLEGNDINYDGGYGEDTDFGLSLSKIGATVLFNPFSANLHLKPPQGGYRFWGKQAKIIGKNRKQQPWELDTPVKDIIPVPSPTMMYLFYKHYNAKERREYKYKYFFLFLFKKGSILTLPLRLLQIPKKNKQYRISQFYAKKLMALGKRTH